MEVTERLLASRTGQPALPLVLEPARPEMRSAEALADWTAEHRQTLLEKKLKHGALLFRNFDLQTAEDFETAALALTPHLKNQYLGTSPRLGRTRYIFSASELPDFYPIMQHLEMSFLPASMPAHLAFYCLVAAPQGGETPLTDFAAVWQSLPQETRAAFAEKGIRNIRNYNGPNSPKGLDLWQLKPWHEMFNTTDKDEVSATCASQGLEAEWLPGDRLRITNSQPAWRPHPVTGEPVWNNHLQVFHPLGAPLEYRQILARRPGLRNLATTALVEVMSAAKKLMLKPEDQATYCTYADGTEIPEQYVAHVQQAIWDNMVYFRWRQGDIVAIDNYRVSHGRLPYHGPRDVLVAWTGQEWWPPVDGTEPAAAEDAAPKKKAAPRKKKEEV